MTFLESLSAARDTHDPAEYVRRVKNVVRDELVLLDPTSAIETTAYFNHTAVPDFVVSWPGDASRHNAPRREVFLRHSYRSILEGGDEIYLDHSDAMLLSIAPESETNALPSNPARAQSRLLVTDSAAVQVVAREEQNEAGPLGELIRANFIRGAKGRIDPPSAAQLVELDDAGSNLEPGEAEALIALSFSEDAAARITRTARLIEFALRGESTPSSELRGRLSLAELRYLLPWLLGRDPSSINPEFWSYVGQLFGFKELESIREDLVDLDLTPLVQANAQRWGARRAYVGLAVSADEDRPSPAEPRGWGFQAGSLSALSVDVGPRRLFIAAAGTLLKARPTTSSASWEQVRPAVVGGRLRRVDLRGIRRSVSINAEQSPDIQSDVEEVTRSLDDDYFVDAVTLRFDAPGDAEGSVDLDVQFDQGLVVAVADASLADLTRAALGVLEYRNPVSATEMTDLLGASHAPNTNTERRPE